MQRENCNPSCTCACEYKKQIEDLKTAIQYYQNTLNNHLHLVDMAINRKRTPLKAKKVFMYK